MVLLAITAEGLGEAIELAKLRHFPVWCGANAISEQDCALLTEVNLSRFTYSLDNAGTEEIADALTTIAEHHPGQRIWIECNNYMLHPSFNNPNSN
jgi:hypothetical protein